RSASWQPPAPTDRPTCHRRDLSASTTTATWCSQIFASPGTIANLRRDPRVEINCVDFLRRRGYRFKGRAEIIEPGDHPAYRWIADWLCQTHGPKVPAHQAVLVSVERALPVDSPAYTVLGAQEDDLLRAWARRYGEGLEQHLS